MTWSLVTQARYNGSNKTETIHPGLFRPREEHLPLAKEMLRKMDFLLDLSFPNAQCNSAILKLMGITKKPLPTTNSYKHDYKSAFDSRIYESMNDLDIRLYDYARSLIEVDCSFFLEVLRRYPSLKERSSA